MTALDEDVAPAVVVPDHPAQFPKVILELLGRMLTAEHAARGPLKVLDPFAGAGGVHKLAQEGVETFGVELQPEWAAAHPDTICGSVLELPSIFPAATFDVLCSSPCYGSRMADSHDAKDPCRKCDGTGTIERPATPTEVDNGHELGIAFDRCKACRGSGLTLRNTYTHALARSGVDIVRTDDNSALMQFGQTYRAFHAKAWRACDRVLRPGGLVLLNVKNHVRAGKVERVVEYHLNEWLVLGYTLDEARRVPTKGLPVGANRDVRVDAELVLALRKPA